MEARKVSEHTRRPFQLSVRIRHPSMDPAEISRELNMEAEHSFRAGDRRPSRSGLPESRYSESYWIGVLKPGGRVMKAPFPFPGHPWSQTVQHQLDTPIGSLGWVLSLSAPRFFRTHAQALQRIRSEGGQVSLLVAISSSEVSSFTLAPEASRLFGELGITVEFELATD
jgi:hypothetical protein